MDLKSFKEYVRLHLISLEQDSQQTVNEMNLIEDMDSDEYKFKEIEDVSNNGKILAVGSIMSLARGILINPTNEE